MPTTFDTFADCADDARLLREYASNPNKSFLDESVEKSLIQRNVLLGTITKEQATNMSSMQLADLIEMGVQ